MAQYHKGLVRYVDLSHSVRERKRERKKKREKDRERE